MKTDKLRVSLAFSRGTDTNVLDTAGAVLANLYDKPYFPDPPVAAPDLQAGIDALNTAIAAQAQGGTAATAEKNLRKEELVALLEKLALYVQVASNNNLAWLLSSGFSAVSKNRAQSQLPKPTGLRLENGLSGQSLLSVDRIPNSRCFEIEAGMLDDEGRPGPWMHRGLVTVSRNMPVNDLVPGKLYLFRTRAVGGSTGYSDWSDPASHRAM